jgi:hypothetical protein
MTRTNSKLQIRISPGLPVCVGQCHFETIRVTPGEANLAGTAPHSTAQHSMTRHDRAQQSLAHVWVHSKHQHGWGAYMCMKLSASLAVLKAARCSMLPLLLYRLSERPPVLCHTSNAWHGSCHTLPHAAAYLLLLAKTDQSVNTYAAQLAWYPQW